MKRTGDGPIIFHFANGSSLGKATPVNTPARKPGGAGRARRWAAPQALERRRRKIGKAPLANSNLPVCAIHHICRPRESVVGECLTFARECLR